MAIAIAFMKEKIILFPLLFTAIIPRDQNIRKEEVGQLAFHSLASAARALYGK